MGGFERVDILFLEFYFAIFLEHLPRFIRQI